MQQALRIVISIAVFIYHCLDNPPGIFSFFWKLKDRDRDRRVVIWDEVFFVSLLVGCNLSALLARGETGAQQAIVGEQIFVNSSGLFTFALFDQHYDHFGFDEIDSRG